MTRTDKKERIIKIFKETRYINEWFDYEDYIDISIDRKSIRIFDKNIEELLFNDLIIYYNEAIEFLKKEDPSFKEALGYAMELGYNLDEIDSEKLANLVLEARIRDEWNEIKDEIERILTEDNDDSDNNN